MPPYLLLLLSVLFARPAADPAWRFRLLLHAVVLGGCLVSAALPGGGSPALCLAGATATLLQAAWHGRSGVREGGLVMSFPALAATGGWRVAAWLLAGLLLAGLAARLVPEPALPAVPRGLLTVSIGIVLCGLCALVAARTERGRIAALLPASNGLLLAACALPGAGWLSLAGIVFVQGGLLWLLSQAQAQVTPGMAPPA